MTNIHSRDATSEAMRHAIYLDYQATTPVDDRVREAMQPFFSQEFGNPHSASHEFGRRATRAIEMAREQIANLVGAEAEDVLFTSGATEANNLALFGLAKGWGTGQPNLLISSIEHPSVIEPAKVLEGRGHKLVMLPVDCAGKLDLKFFEHNLGAGPNLISIGAANGEIGTTQSLAKLSDLCGETDSVLHSDISQAAGKLPIHLYDDGIQLLTLSSHKLYGPKGIGALIVAAPYRRHLTPMIYGGGQENGLRAGTLSTALCVGLGMACELASQELKSGTERILRHRTSFLNQLAERVGGISVNGDVEERLPGNLSLKIDGVDGLRLLSSVPQLALSTGSACNSSKSNVTASHVLTAIGLDDEGIRSTVRVSFGRNTTDQDVSLASKYLADAILRQRDDKGRDM